MSSGGSIHSVRRSQCHLAWDNSIPPVLTVNSGETVTFDCLDASNGQITPFSTPGTLASLVFSQLDQVNGPVYVTGAKPGDTIEVEVIEVKTSSWGWTGLIPGFGLLSDDPEFAQPALKLYELDTEQGWTWFDKAKGIRIPLRPFPGEIGVAPGKAGAHSTIPPYKTGGNLDTRYFTKGTKVYLPVEVEGGLVSVGDGHAAQGDGEVCGTAIETPITITLRLTVVKGMPYVKTPHFLVPPEHPFSSIGDAGYYATTGVEDSLLAATRAAVQHMITFLGAQYGLSRVEAYMLVSVAGELKLHEVVDMPNYVVGCMMPKGVFL